MGKTKIKGSKRSNGISAKNWVILVGFGLLGQIAWCIENSYLNFFIDRTLTTNSFAIAFMVAASAVVATVTTLFMGIFTDRVGKRIPFMSLGYILWGISIMLFALITVDNISKLFGFGEAERDSAMLVGVAFVVVLDCVMTFLGSTANDAAFNAWVTDFTDDGNRGKIEGVLSILAAVATAIVFGLFDGMTQNKYFDAEGNPVTRMVSGGYKVVGNWTLFFCLLGGIVIVMGIIGKLLLGNKERAVKNPDLKYKDVLYGFKPSVIKKNKILYLSLAGIGLTGIAGNAFLPFFMIYMERSLGYTNYIIPMAAIYATSCIAGVIMGFIMDKRGNKFRFLVPGFIIYIVGILGMFFVSPLFFKSVNMVPFCLVSFLQALGGYILSIVFQSTVRERTPKNKVGMFQGVRMVFSVLIPMCVGPMITAILNNLNKDNVEILEDGTKVYSYGAEMFLVSLVAVLLCLIPILFIVRYIRDESATKKGIEGARYIFTKLEEQKTTEAETDLVIE